MLITCVIWMVIDVVMHGQGRVTWRTTRFLLRYKLTLLQVVPRQNTILERTQTSVVNKTNTYLREPPHVPKPPTQWEHANETKFWLSLFIENRDSYKNIWDFFYNSSAYYTYDQETGILSIMSCKSVMQRTHEETGVILARGFINYHTNRRVN